MLTFFVLFLEICVVESKARDSANIWGGSRVLLVTDLPNATVSVDKLYTSLADRGLADVFNRLVIIQRGHDGHFIKSHGSFRALSRVQDRTLWSISKKETLPWLLKEEANVIICVADSKADVPRILISAQRKGMFPPDIKLMIWMIQDDVMAADGMNMISLISPGDFDPQSSSLDDDPSFASEKVHSIFARNLESAVIELFQIAKNDVHHRERRNVNSTSSSMTTKVLSSNHAAPQSLSSSMTTKAPNSSPMFGQSMLSSMPTKLSISSSSSAVSQSVSSSMPTKVSIPISSLAVSQSVSSSLTAKVSIPSSSSAVSQSVSSSMTPKVAIPSSSSASQSVSSSMPTKVSIPSLSSAVRQSVSSSMTPKVAIPSSSSASQSVSSSMPTKVSIPSSSSAVSQSVSSSLIAKVSISSSSSAVSQSVSSSMTTKVSILSSISAVSQSVSSSMTPKVAIPSSSLAAGKSMSSFLTSQVVAQRSSAATAPVVTTAPVVSSPVGLSTSVPVTTKVTAPTAATHTVSPFISSSVAVMPTESAASTVSNSRSTPMVVSSTPSTLAPTTEGKKNEIAFILYITFGALMACIFIVGFVVLVVRCRRDRHEGSFHLNSHTSYELGRFHGIPRANTSYDRVDFYGEPVEMDAAVANPEVDDEFQAEGGVYPYDVSPTGGRAAASNCTDVKEEKFNVDAMGMPEWKNLPKLSAKEITVAEPSEDIPKSSGSVGSRHLLMDDEPKDSGHAYDNPVLTFGDGPTGLDKEDS